MSMVLAVNLLLVSVNHAIENVRSCWSKLAGPIVYVDHKGEVFDCFADLRAGISTILHPATLNGYKSDKSQERES